MSVHMAGPVAYLEQSNSAVFFSAPGTGGGQSTASKGTATIVKQLQNALNVAYWGEDNRFPQHIEQQMAYCGIGKAGLNWKAQALWGSGIIPGKITGYEDGGTTEIFEPLDRTKYKDIYNFIENRRMFRFWLEYMQDWVWYGNCFPELILSKDAKTITGLVQQESCDSRFMQMNDKGVMEKVFLSKLWGAAGDQYVKFDPTKKMRGILENSPSLLTIDNKFVKALDCIDMYDPVNSLQQIAQSLRNSKGLGAFKSAILPTNYPSVNKTYYQVPAWDGARLGGWVEIACKEPTIIKALINKAYRIKNHIEVPESYFERRCGYEKWHSMKAEEQVQERKSLLKDMDDFLTGDENAFKSFISFFDVDPVTKKEFGQVKINPIEDKASVDKDLVIGSAADIQILIAMQVHPTLFGAGTVGTGKQQSGGSDIREAFLVYNALLNLERNVLLEPLYLVRDYNREVGGMSEWEEDIVFRIRDTVLTTLDTGAGTQKVVS